MNSPIHDILKNYLYKPRWDVQIQYQIRNEIIDLDIPGLVDVQFHQENSNRIRVTPVFSTEQDHMWYNLKYGDPL
jgi:hypothetical protein